MAIIRAAPPGSHRCLQTLPDDSAIPLDEQLGAIGQLREEGKNLADRAASDVLRAREADRIAFMPWAPIAM
jgi:hypothetical protein